MPELPDVEGFRRELARTLPGRRVRHVDVLDAGVLRNTTARTLARNLTGHRFEKPRRQPSLCGTRLKRRGIAGRTSV
jgi:formamidopyrimidine-DNA glycosylase